MAKYFKYAKDNKKRNTALALLGTAALAGGGAWAANKGVLGDNMQNAYRQSLNVLPKDMAYSLGKPQPKITWGDVAYHLLVPWQLKWRQ